jgi:hypothetical protein
MGQAADRLVCRSTSPGVQVRPCGSGRKRAPARSGPSTPLAWSRRRDEALLSAPLGNSATVPAKTAGPQGERDARAGAGCLARAREDAGDRPAAIAVNAEPEKGGPALDCVCGQRWCASGVATVQQSSVSQLRLSVVQAKDSSSRSSYVACENIVNACQEYEELSGLATAKLRRKRERLDLAHPPACGTALIYWRFT